MERIVLPQGGSLYKRPGSSAWWMEIGDGHGQMVRRTTGTSDPKVAKKVLKALRDDIGAARRGHTTLVTTDIRSTTVQSLLDSLLFKLRDARAIVSLRSHVAHLSKAFGTWKAADLDEAAIDRYIATRETAGHAKASINHSLQLLAQGLKPFLAKHCLPMPTINRIKNASNVREGFYSAAQAEALIAALPEDLRDFTRWGWLTGWRKMEISSLKWADVDRQAGSIRLSWRASKNKTARSMALVGELAAIIERRWQARTITLKNGTTVLSDLVFHRGAVNGQARPVKDIDFAFRTACRVAGIEYGRFGGRTFHCFRRTASRNLRNAGVPENICMAVTGHKTPSMFKRYAITNDQDIADAMIQVQAHLQAQPQPATNVIPLRQATAQ
jgi:integrase